MFFLPNVQYFNVSKPTKITYFQEKIELKILYSTLEPMVMITTGDTGDHTSLCNATQLVDLSSSSNYYHCLSDYPLVMTYGTGALVLDSPIICGGRKRENMYSPDVPTSECFKYNKSSNEWKWLASMKNNRSYSSSVAINGTLFVTGGVDGDGQNLDSTELISYNGTVTTGPILPFALANHCMVTLTSGDIMILGDFGSSNYF